MRFELAGAMEIKKELPDGDADGKLHGDELLVAERVAAARPGGVIRTGDVIERIIARHNLTRPVSPPARMQAPATPQCAGPSGLNAYLLPFRRRVDSFDEEEPERLVWPPRRPRLEFDVGDYEQEEALNRSRRDAGSGRDAEQIYLLTLRQAWTAMQVATKEVTTRMMT